MSPAKRPRAAHTKATDDDEGLMAPADGHVEHSVTSEEEASDRGVPETEGVSDAPADVTEPTPEDDPTVLRPGPADEEGDPVVSPGPVATTARQAEGMPVAGADPGGLTAPADGQIEHHVTTPEDVEGLIVESDDVTDASDPAGGVKGDLYSPADGQIEHFVTPSDQPTPVEADAEAE